MWKGNLFMDKLYECAASYQKLLGVNYKIILGRKGKLIELRICFEPLHFHHLIGLHKLTDLRIARENREKVFNRILSGAVTYDSIARSRYFRIAEQRMEPFSHFEEILDQNRLVFRYNDKKNLFSLIEADYLLSTPYGCTDIYIFVAETHGKGTYFCRSFFPKEDRDYTAGQTIYTMLYKEKIYLDTGKAVVQYDRLTPKATT